MNYNRPEPNQAQWIHDYNDATRLKFNPVLFERKDSDLVEALKKVILSFQRDGLFTIRVKSFRVEEDYAAIMRILYDHEQKKIDKNKNNKADNIYKYINLKDSDIFLLIVNYEISVNEGPNAAVDELEVIIELPRIVDKYYYRIAGTYYLSIYQIVDGSTYNNSSSKSKKSSVTEKTIFMPVRLYRNIRVMKDTYGIPHDTVQYTSRLFSKTIPVMDYYLAKMGLYGALEYFGLSGINVSMYDDSSNPNLYCFLSKCGLYVSVPKYIFDNDFVTQNAVYSIFHQLDSSYKDILAEKGKTPLEVIQDQEFWVAALAGKFTQKMYIEKGRSVLESLELIYDLDTKEGLHLPEEDKEDIYAVIRWMVREFQALRLKDITDISTKKVRREKYIGATYATKVVKGIYRASDQSTATTIDMVKRYIYTEPDFLINKITKDKLVAFRNSVNDNDAVAALKFSYKGVSGLGDQKNSTIPQMFRYVHHSHLGRVDVDTSSPTDPGLSGIIAPLTKLYDGSFSEYEEPNSWRDEYGKLVEDYRNLCGTRDLARFEESIMEELDGLVQKRNPEEMDKLDYALQQHRVALEAYEDMNDSSEYICTEYTEDDADEFVICDEDDDDLDIDIVD